MVGDRGMITTARITALRTDTELGWLTTLRAPAIGKLAADDGPLQPTLFDQQNLAEISHPDYPGERLIACRNPFLADERARKRTELLAATEAALAPIQTRWRPGGCRRGPDRDRGRQGAQHPQDGQTPARADHRHQPDHHPQPPADRRRGRPGRHLRHPHQRPRAHPHTAAAVTAYKNLANVERDFRHIKADDLQLRPIHHRLEDRVRAHVLIAMLAAYLIWHLRATLAPLTFTDEHPPTRTDPVAPAQRSAAAARKASRQTSHDDQPVRSFRGLLEHLATLTRNDIQYGPNGPIVPTLAAPTPTQRRAFELLDSPIPLTLK